MCRDADVNGNCGGCAFVTTNDNMEAWWAVQLPKKVKKNITFIFTYMHRNRCININDHFDACWAVQLHKKIVLVKFMFMYI